MPFGNETVSMTCNRIGDWCDTLNADHNFMDWWKINLTEIGKRRRFSEGKLFRSFFYFKYNQIFHF